MSTFLRRIFYSFIPLIVSLACGQSSENLPKSQSNPPQPTELESVTVAEVIDGDTVNLADGERVRYIGLNTPERDEAYYDEATQLNRQLLNAGPVQLEFDVETQDQFGRTLAYIWVDGVLVNLEIVRQGYANMLVVPPNNRYEAEFRQAEAEARQAKRGMWQGVSVPLKITYIKANARGKDNENPNGEWVEISNTGDAPINMQGYTLQDAGNHSYTFNKFSLAAGQTVQVYSGRGQDRADSLYWGLVDDSVWNNRGDSAFLRNAEGNLVDRYEYRND